MRNKKSDSSNPKDSQKGTHSSPITRARAKMAENIP